MLRSTKIIAIAFGFAAPAMAEAPAATGSFDGQRFYHQSRLESGDTILIEGNFLEGGEKFRFAVKPSGRVDGTVGATPVSFRVSKEKRDRLARAIRRAEPAVVDAARAFPAGAN